MRSSRKMHWRLFLLAIVALFVFGCNSAKRVTTTADTDDVNADGNTALIEAARFGHDDVITALLVARADVSTKNKQGKTALMLASEGGHDECVRLLTQATR